MYVTESWSVTYSSLFELNVTCMFTLMQPEVFQTIAFLHALYVLASIQYFTGENAKVRLNKILLVYILIKVFFCYLLSSWKDVSFVIVVIILRNLRKIRCWNKIVFFLSYIYQELPFYRYIKACMFKAWKVSSKIFYQCSQK